MNGHDGLERELTVWLADVATPRVPDYTNDIVRMTAGLRQRPRWTFLERWLPMRVDTLQRVPAPPTPWRTIALLALIAVLTAALVLVGVGRAQRHPAPFGLAANGLIAYGLGGDIFTLDPATGDRHAIVTGPEDDIDARWSLDGTRLAFLRAMGRGTQVVIVDGDGDQPRVISSPVLLDVDSDSVKWSPDGRTIIVVYGVGVRQIGLVDTADGRLTNVPLADYESLEVFWRPPDGREVLYVSRDGETLGLSIVSMDGFAARDVPLAPGTRDDLRAMGWTPDGSGIVAHRRWPDGGRERTDIIDPITGTETVLDVAYGHISNGGTRIAGLTTSGGLQRVCVIDIAGGPCVSLGGSKIAGGGPHGEGLQWSPDDEWIVVQPDNGGPPVLLDPDRDGSDAVGQTLEGAETWQRTAP
jgi:hypothetical protein